MVRAVASRDWCKRTIFSSTDTSNCLCSGRFQLDRFVRRRRCGLLITSHRETVFPTVHTTTVDFGLAKTLVAELASATWSKRYESEIEHAFDLHNGNVREVFFDLYDLFERHRERPGSFS